MTQPSAVKPKAGFTLVEMLVAFAVGALVLVVLAQIVGQSMTISRSSNNALLANNAASSAVDLISSDIESLAVTREPFEFLQTVKENVGDLRDTTRLMLISGGGWDASGDPDYSQLRAISYRIINQDPINPGGNRRVYGLYRTVSTAADTFENFLGESNLAGPFAGQQPTLDDFVVGNVIDFQIRFFAPGDQIPENMPASVVQPVRLSGNSTTINGSNYTGAPLAWAEVSLTIIEDRDDAVRRLESGALTLADARRQYGLSLSRRVAIRSPY